MIWLRTGSRGVFMTLLGNSRYAAAFAALALVACGGGSDSSSSSSPPPTGGGGTPAPSPTPTPTPAPRFSFSVPFAFDSAVGVEGVEFTARDSFRLALIDRRFLSNDRMARLTFTPQGENQIIEYRYDNISLSATVAALTNPRFSVVGRDADQEGLAIELATDEAGMLVNGSAEVAVTHYRSAQSARTFETAVGTGQRQVIAIIGNPATEFGRITRSKDYQSSGRFTGNVTMGNRFNLSSDYNSGITGSPILNYVDLNGQQQRANLYIEGAHDVTTNRLAGRVRNGQQGEVIGTWEGALYGPNRNHVGMVFDIDLPQTGRRHIGWTIGSGQDVR